MFKSTLLFTKVAALAAAVVLTFAGQSWAQRGGGHGGGHGGGGHGGGGHGGFAGGHGHGGFGGHGFGGRGFGGFYGGWGYGGWDWGYPYAGGYYGGYDGGYYAPIYRPVPYYNYDLYVPGTGYQSYYPPDATYGRANDNTASIEVLVPANAKLWFDGKETSQTGPDRFFATPALEPGKTFTYEVRATWTDSNGQPVTRTREVQVQANRPVLVSFVENPAR
jgi:uncharacterized protein (TIGR03000 family)